jgi:hypothetical protein
MKPAATALVIVATSPIISSITQKVIDCHKIDFLCPGDLAMFSAASKNHPHPNA